MVQGPGDPPRDSPGDSIGELLPAYALNALDADERKLVESALAASPRYRAALAEYLEGFAQLAESQVVLLPSLDLRDRIMAAAGAQGPARLATERGRRERPRSAFRGLWAAVAASVLVFVGLGGLAVAQSFRVNDLEAEMGGLSVSAAATQASLDGQRAEMATLTASAAATQVRLDGQIDEMDVLQGTAAEMEAKLVSQQELTYFVAHESTSMTRMWAMATPEPSAKPARGMLIADPDGGGQLLMTLFLRPLGSSQAYQAWVWESDETAFSIAVFAVDHSGYALVPVVFPEGEVNVNWVSINIAPAGGEATPTGLPVLAGPMEYR